MSVGLAVLSTLFFAFVGLRGCVVEVWRSPEKPELYTIQGSDRRALSLLMLPGNRVIMGYIDPEKVRFEAASAIWRGSSGDHYFGNFWHADSGGLWGWQQFPSGFTPYSMEIEILDKFKAGEGDETFPSVGETTRGIVGLAPGRVLFGGMTLTGAPVEPDFLLEMAGLFSDAATKEALLSLDSRR